MTEIAEAIPEHALEWHQAGIGAVLATVIETWGSAPRRAGSQMAVSSDMQVMGSVSGGCVEAAVIAEALAAIQDQRSRILTYGVADENAFSVGLACGGTIRVLVEPVGKGLPESMLAELVAARAARQPIAYQVNLESRKGRLIRPDAGNRALFRADRSGIEAGIFTAIHNPPLRMAIIGAVHIAQHLAPMAQACGYDVLVIDPREVFAAPSRFPQTRLCLDWPDVALAKLGLDGRTALVTLGHDPKLDDPAIQVALRSDAFYIGCLGSRQTTERRRARMVASGFTAPELDRLHAPVGLAIGAATPAEIALAIMAEVTQMLRQGTM